MTTDHFQRAKELFLAVCEIEAAQQTAYLDEACAGDKKLRSDVELLLSHDDTADYTDEDAPGINPEGFVHADSAAHLKSGDRIDGFVIRDLLGEGGFANVYLAEQTEPVRRLVALKIIKLGMDTKQVIARFKAEKQALAMMDHPNVAKVFDAGVAPPEAGSRPYFVMEYVAGEPITTFCDRHLLSTNERLELFMQACKGVQHAHQKGIIHRDIKPTNVLVSVEGAERSVKVIDFGIAKAISQRLTEQTLYTEQGQVIGTPEYMSPEQAEMSSLNVDTRTDIYSLGVLLYELLVGALPFDPKTLRKAAFGEIQRIIREEEPPKPSTRLSTMGDESAQYARHRHTDPTSLQRELRGDLDWITMRAMEKDRIRRYESAAALAADLRRHLGHEPIEASPPSAKYRIGKFVRRNRELVAACLIVLVVLAGGIVTSTVFAIGQASARRDAVAARDAEVEQREIAENKANEAERQQVRAEDAEQLASDRLNETEVAQAEAEQQLAVTIEILSFLTSELLGSVNPSAGGNRDITMREALDNASEKIADRFPEDPLIEARIRYTIGKTYRGLGLYDPAVMHLEKALDILRSEMGEKHADTLLIMNGLAVYYHGAGRWEDAEKLYLETLELQPEVLGDDHPEHLRTLGSYAVLLKEQDKFEEAEPIYRRVLEGKRNAYGPEDSSTLLTMVNLGGFYDQLGRFEEGEAILLEALEIIRRVQGEDHRNTHVLNNLGKLYMSQDRFDEAEPHFTKALEINRVLLGDDHWVTLIAMTNMGELFEKTGRLEEAEEIYLDTLNRRKATLGEEHPATASAMNHLGKLYMNTKQYDLAEPLLIQAGERTIEFFGVDHSNSQSVIRSLIELYETMGQPEKMETWLDKISPSSPIN